MPRIVDHSKTKCAKCGSSDTYINTGGTSDWRIHYDEKGVWDRKSYECKRCNQGDYQRYSEDSQNNIRKGISNSRNSQIYIYSRRGKGLIGEAVIAKVRSLKVVSIESDNFNHIFDLSPDPEYGIIQSKLCTPHFWDWYPSFGREHNFDTLCTLCASIHMIDIDEVYMIAEHELYGLANIRIHHGNCKWKRFRVDGKTKNIYNDTYHSLLSFLGDKKYFGIDDIKKWMEL